MNTPHNLESISKLNALITDIKYVMLTTIDQNQQLVARPMTMQKNVCDGNLWFLTDRRINTPEDLQRNPQINISVIENSPQRYISISGIGALIDDAAKRNEMWDGSYLSWFPGGIEDPHLGLLRVTVHQVDYWRTPESWGGKIISLAKLMAGDETVAIRREQIHM